VANTDIFYIFSNQTNWFIDLGWCYFNVRCFRY